MINNIGQFLDINVWRYGEYKQLIYLAANTEKSFTNSEILDNARALATGLKTLGIKKGDIVATVLSNVPEVPEIINATLRIGAVYLPVVFMLTPEEMSYVIDDSNCKIIITEEKLLEKVTEAYSKAGKTVPIAVISKDTHKGIIDYRDLKEICDERGNLVDTARDDLAFLIYVPGAGGYPKGVKLSHYNMYCQMKSCISLWEIDKGESVLTTMPLNTIYGIISCIEGYIAGFVNILMPPFDPRLVLDAVRKYRVKVLPVVPTMLNFMLLVWDPVIDDLSSLDFLICSGAPLPLDILKKARETFEIDITQAYGCTEAGGAISMQRRDWPHKDGSTGFPIPGISVKIVDDNGLEVGRCTEGEIICKGPMISSGYLNRSKETLCAFKDGWFYTGDIGRFDNDGELYITGRKKDIIIKGEENIDPAVSENWLNQHPAVMECSVFGIDDDKYGEEIAAAVVLKPGYDITEESLQQFLKEHVHHYVSPKKIIFLQSLPKTSTGRVRKNELKKLIDYQSK